MRRHRRILRCQKGVLKHYRQLKIIGMAHLGACRCESGPPGFLRGLKQVRGLLPNSPGREMFDALIVEAEEHIAEVKQKVIQ